MANSQNSSLCDCLRHLLPITDPEVVRSALLAIDRQEEVCDIPLLLPFLENDDAQIRSAAISALTVQKSDEVLTLLLDIARQDTDPEVREYALHLLGDYVHPQVFACLLEEIDRPKLERFPRQTVATQLANYDCPESIAALQTLFGDDDYIVQDHATESLLKLNRPEFHEFWQMVLHVSKDPVVLVTAQTALAQLSHVQ